MRLDGCAIVSARGNISFSLSTIFRGEQIRLPQKPNNHKKKQRQKKTRSPPEKIKNTEKRLKIKNIFVCPHFHSKQAPKSQTPLAQNGKTCHLVVLFVTQINRDGFRWQPKQTTKVFVFNVLL
jgi:hypothetical protein